ncbi:ATPase [Dipodascopsis tothii]|uniref:ATPase n=1 Tax=Dipodascopsis tothii TaxID=44089 RepID=UPI0034CD1661
MAQTMAAFRSRNILEKQRRYGYYSPAAYGVALVLTDLPVLFFQVLTFSIVFYFMCGFRRTAGAFFTFLVIIYAATVALNAFFRMWGFLFRSFNAASKVTGVIMSVFLVYGGFLIPKVQMHPWFKWIIYLSPMSFGLEAIVANQFLGLEMSCGYPNLVPSGDGYGNIPAGEAACLVRGKAYTTTEDSATFHVVASDYIAEAFSYEVSHIWRNFGIIIAWGVGYILIYLFCMEFFRSGGGESLVLSFVRGSERARRAVAGDDEEKTVSLSTSDIVGVHAVEAAHGVVLDEKAAAGDAGSADGLGHHNEAVFTWRHLRYTVAVKGGDRLLLDNVQGWIKPGTLGALMGASGAGKTTLLDVLAQRKDSGVVTGEVLVDGRAVGVSFQRQTGYCEQLDIHDPTTTVREAMIYSALLRQDRGVPDADKIKYVDEVIDLLEMDDVADAIVGLPGQGLSVEQRKRLTIGVELAAKPGIVLFLDEPTSGLDGQSSYNVLRFLRKLAASGQSVLCTIHQPSASLFEMFDTLLLLAPGGKTVYFGDIGPRSAVVKDYFGRNGAPCPDDMNPADHIVNIVTTPRADGSTWNDVWLASPEVAAVEAELDRLKVDLNSRPTTIDLDLDTEFATTMGAQARVILRRQVIAVWRNPDYVVNKVVIHLAGGLLNGFTYYNLSDRLVDLDNYLFSIFFFLFVAPGVINQMQPLFIANRNLFEAREKKSKMFSWQVFVLGQIVPEIPYLLVCGTLYYVCWYFASGFPTRSAVAGQFYVVLILYEFLYTSLGQTIAAYAPSEFFASLANPLILGCFFISFSGVLVPYSNIQAFWRYWLYWIDPFQYLLGALLTKPLYAIDIHCRDDELARFAPPANTTCGDYMAPFLAENTGYVVDPTSTSLCEYCQFSTGAEFAKQYNYNSDSYGWRDTGILAGFILFFYGSVFLMMKTRTKKTKSAKAD